MARVAPRPSRRKPPRKPPPKPPPRPPITSATENRQNLDRHRGTLDQKVAEVAERARPAHFDPTVRVTLVEPWSLKSRPVSVGKSPRRIHPGN